MPMSRATARSDRFAPSVARCRRAIALISLIISARTRARMDPAGIQLIVAHVREHCSLRLRLKVTTVLEREHCSPREETSMSLHVIVGSGSVGSATAQLLAERGERVRIVTRRGGGPEHPAIERVAADATDPNRLSALTEGAAALYNC